MIFKPIPERTRWESLVAVVWLLLIGGLILAWAWARPTDWLKFGLMVLAVAVAPVWGYVLYRTWAAFTLEYWVDRNSVTLRWAHVRQVVPISAIQRILDGGVLEIGQPRWYHWPLPWVRPARAEGLPNILLCATRPLNECLLLDTGDVVFAVSPQWRTRFVDQLQESYRMGAVLTLGVSEPPPLRTRRWLRQHGVGLALLSIGLVGVLALFGRLMVEFPTLPSLLPFHYDSQGLPDVVRDKSALFVLPAIGLLTWLTNGLWGVWMAIRKQSTGAYMLWGGAIVVQIFSLLALNSLLP
jgi:hypothetical protein